MIVISDDDDEETEEETKDGDYEDYKEESKDDDPYQQVSTSRILSGDLDSTDWIHYNGYRPMILGWMNYLMELGNKKDVVCGRNFATFDSLIYYAVASEGTKKNQSFFFYKDDLHKASDWSEETIMQPKYYKDDGSPVYRLYKVKKKDKKYDYFKNKVKGDGRWVDKIDKSNTYRVFINRERPAQRKGKFFGWKKMIQEIKRCKKESPESKYSLFYLRIDFKVDAHANILIYDHRKDAMYRFEPHGSMNKYKVDMALLMQTIVEHSTDSTILKGGYTRIADFCPERGIQKVELLSKKFLLSFTTNKGKKGKIMESDGYCALWSVMFVHFMLEYADTYTLKEVQYIMLKNKDPDRLAVEIRKYANFVLSWNRKRL